MPESAIAVRIALAAGSAWQALDPAPAAARAAGEKVIRDNPRLPPGEQLVLALRAADEALEGLAVGLASGELAGG